jgi:MoaA/NifB/PqqE/SkfB family radical SAM enzyme
LGVVYLYLTGGEPLLRNDLPTVVAEAKHLRFEKIHVATNGLLLSESRMRELVACGLDMITVSLNGVGSVHDTSRGIPGSYERCMKTLQMLTKVRNDFPDLKIGIQTILMEQNVDQIPDLMRVCKNLQIGFSLCLLDNNPFLFRNAPDLHIQKPTKLDAIIDELHKMLKTSSVIQDTHTSLEYTKRYYRGDRRRRDIPCYLGYLSVHIGSLGEVYSGCEVLPHLGNIREKSLYAIVNSPSYKFRLRQMFLKKCPGCSCGHRFNQYAHLPTILEEALWILRS